MDDVFVYFIKLPPKINEIVLPCNGGYTIYIDSGLSWEKKRKVFEHAIGHIENGDFEKADVQQIEYDAHRRE